MRGGFEKTNTPDTKNVAKYLKLVELIEFGTKWDDQSLTEAVSKVKILANLVIPNLFRDLIIQCVWILKQAFDVSSVERSG